MVRTYAIFMVTFLVGCASDALYTYCDDPAQCGSRTYTDDEIEIEVVLDCIEVTVDAEPGRTTRGNFCTLPCEGSHDCGSRLGLGDGACIRLAGDDASFCYQRCDDQPCYPSSQCESLLVAGLSQRVCVPIRTP